MNKAGTKEQMKKELILFFHKPLIPTELKNISGFGINYICYRLKGYFDRGLVSVLSPGKTGKVYGLTKKGNNYRSKLNVDIGSDNPVSYSEPKNIDWRLYGWVISGKAKKDYLKIMVETEKRLNGPFKASHIFLRYRYEGIKSTPRTEVYRALWAFEKKGIVKRIPCGKRNVKYLVTKKGKAVFDLLMF